jgi:hypothetical protein
MPGYDVDPLRMLFIGVGVGVLTLSTVCFVLAATAFLAPYGLVFLRSASSMKRSMLGYAGSLRFTARQRSSAAP